MNAQSSADTPRPADRVVHQFDFDERQDGNLEDVPQFWEPLRPGGFPKFANGGFDFEVGHTAAPSFHLYSAGRNVAYIYSGHDTRVRPSSDYRIEAFIKPDRLAHARACISAHFLDRHGQMILGTLVRSPYVGGHESEQEWIKVQLYLPSAPMSAHSIGLIAWTVQEPVWSHTTLVRRYISRRDVFGGAWFDDITVHALPRAELSTTVPGHVLQSGNPQELLVTLSDTVDSTLRGRLTITAADGKKIASHEISVYLGDSDRPTSIDVSHLLPGLYTACLDVWSGDDKLLSRSLNFARLSDRLSDPGMSARPFGIVVDPRARSSTKIEEVLLDRVLVRSVKVPVWSGLDEPPATASQQDATDQLLQGLVRNGFSLTGVFFGPPSVIVRGDGAYKRSLVEVLQEPKEIWQDYLAGVVAPFASLIRWWQIGPDGTTNTVDPDKLLPAMDSLRQAMREYITAPRIILPVAATASPPQEPLPADQISISIGSEIQPDWFASQIKPLQSANYDKLSVYLEPRSEGEYHRLAGLSSWARRLISARHAGADIVFVPQPWRVRATSQGRVTEPTEEYLFLRTLADVIGDASPGPIVKVIQKVKVVSFHQGDTSVLAIWAPDAPPDGTLLTIQLGRATRQIDLWGHVSQLKKDRQGRHVLRVTAMPILIDGVDRWLIDWRNAIHVVPAYVSSGEELVRHKIDLSADVSIAVTGEAYFEGPKSWEITPRRIGFHHSPGRLETIPVEIRYPHNEPAGDKTIVAKITLRTPPYYLEVPLQVEVGLPGVEVSGMAFVEGRDLVLRHTITNRSKYPISFRAVANVPGSERQYRPMTGIEPGDTQTVEYRFANGTRLIGRTVRLGLRELNDGPRTHNLELVVP